MKKALTQDLKEWLEEYCVYPDECDAKVINCILEEYEEETKEDLETFFNYIVYNGIEIDEWNEQEYTFIRDAYLNDEERLTFFINNSDNVHYLTKEFINNFYDYEKIESYDIIYDEFTGTGYFLPQ